MPVPQPTITVTMRGLMILFIDDNRAECQLGILKAAHGHDKTITITAIPAVGAPQLIRGYRAGEIKSNVSINVENTSQQNVHLYRPVDPSDPQHFGHVLDFEGADVYDEPVDLEPKGIAPIVRIDNGEFRTGRISQNEIRIIDGTITTQRKVALSIVAYINLDQANSVAHFTNGNEPPIDLNPVDGLRYGIDISHSTPPGADPNENHTVHYDQAIKGGKISHRKIRFEPTPLLGASKRRTKRGRSVLRAHLLGDPSSACLIGGAGRTQL